MPVEIKNWKNWRPRQYDIHRNLPYFLQHMQYTPGYNKYEGKDIMRIHWSFTLNGLAGTFQFACVQSLPHLILKLTYTLRPEERLGEPFSFIELNLHDGSNAEVHVTQEFADVLSRFVIDTFQINVNELQQFDEMHRTANKSRLTTLYTNPYLLDI